MISPGERARFCAGGWDTSASALTPKSGAAHERLKQGRVRVVGLERELKAELSSGERSSAKIVRLEQELEPIRPELAAAQTVQAQLHKRAADDSVLSTSSHDTERELADAVGLLDRMREQLAGRGRELSELRAVNADLAKTIHEFTRREEELKGDVGLPQPLVGSGGQCTVIQFSKRRDCCGADGDDRYFEVDLCANRTTVYLYQQIANDEPAQINHAADLRHRALEQHRGRDERRHRRLRPPERCHRRRA